MRTRRSRGCGRSREGASARRGQATVEYLLAISFLAVAMSLAVAGLYRVIQTQTGRLVDDLGDHLEDGPAQ